MDANESSKSRWDIEQALLDIWRDALKTQKVERNDDFFTLGGDSLSAMVVIVRIQQALDLKLPMSALVENPTIGLLACLINSQITEDRRSDSQNEDSILVPVRATGTRPPIFLVHGLMGHVVFAHILGRFLGEDQPLYALRARGFDGQPPLDDVGAMADAYLREVRSVQPKGPYYIGGNCSGSFIMLEMCRRLLAEGQEIGMTLAIDPLEPGVSFTHWRLKIPNFKPGDERSDVFRANLRQRLENEIYGRGGMARQKLDWAVDVAAALDLAIARHKPAAAYPRPITMIASEEMSKRLSDPTKIWRNHIAGAGLQMYIVAPQHLSLFVDHAQRIAKVIRDTMDGITILPKEAARAINSCLSTLPAEFLGN